MGLVLFLLFLVLPLAELYVIVQVAGGIGVLETIALLVLVSIAGAWLVKWQGLMTLARFQRQLAAGRLPTSELVDGVLILFAGALMLTPGFITDVTGLVLLVPPTRIAVRTLLVRRFRVQPPSPGARWIRFGSVVDVDGRQRGPRRGDGGPPTLEP